MVPLLVVTSRIWLAGVENPGELGVVVEITANSHPDGDVRGSSESDPSVVTVPTPGLAPPIPV